MLITALLQFKPESHQQSRNEVVSLCPVKQIVEYEPRTFLFQLQRLNPIGHSLLNIFWKFFKMISRIYYLWYPILVGNWKDFYKTVSFGSYDKYVTDL